MLNLLNARKDTLFHYSPFSFFPKIDKQKLFQYSIVNSVDASMEDGSLEVIRIDVDGKEHLFLLKFLKWDTDYFNMSTYRLFYVLYDHHDYDVLKKATKLFVSSFFKEKGIYCFSEIPSEDIFTIQALNESGFKLVENRLTYYLDLRNYSHERYGVRSAKPEDIENLKRVAREMRNDFDRFHAESIFNADKADEFLATYIEESIKGFVDYTIVPCQDGVASDAFLTANYLRSEWASIGEKVSKMVLSSVSVETCKGWYLKLISEMAFHLKSIGADYAFMHPATTNRAVIHTYEKLGCKYGKCVHILTYTS